MRAVQDGDVNGTLPPCTRRSSKPTKGVCLISLHCPALAVPKDLSNPIDEYE